MVDKDGNQCDPDNKTRCYFIRATLSDVVAKDKTVTFVFSKGDADKRISKLFHVGDDGMVDRFRVTYQGRPHAVNALFKQANFYPKTVDDYQKLIGKDYDITVRSTKTNWKAMRFDHSKIIDEIKEVPRSLIYLGSDIEEIESTDYVKKNTLSGKDLAIFDVLLEGRWDIGRYEHVPYQNNGENSLREALPFLKNNDWSEFILEILLDQDHREHAEVHNFLLGNHGRMPFPNYLGGARDEPSPLENRLVILFIFGRHKAWLTAAGLHDLLGPNNTRIHFTSVMSEMRKNYGYDFDVIALSEKYTRDGWEEVYADIEPKSKEVYIIANLTYGVRWSRKEYIKERIDTVLRTVENDLMSSLGIPYSFSRRYDKTTDVSTLQFGSFFSIDFTPFLLTEPDVTGLWYQLVITFIAGDVPPQQLSEYWSKTLNWISDFNKKSIGKTSLYREKEAPEQWEEDYILLCGELLIDPKNDYEGGRPTVVTDDNNSKPKQIREAYAHYLELLAEKASKFG